MNPQLVISRFSSSAAVAASVLALAGVGAAVAGARSDAPSHRSEAIRVHAFTASHAGSVDAVDLALDGGTTGASRVTVVIRALTGAGQPTRTVLASATVAAADGRLHVQLPTPAAVRSGASYAIAVTAPTGTGIGDASPVYGHGPAASACHAA